MTSRNPVLAALDVLVGEWSMEATFDHVAPAGAGAGGDAGARASFEWMEGGHFLVQRWSVPVPEAPDGIALIGLDPTDGGRCLQHYFDSRGVARVYKVTLEGGTWTLWRDEADVSPLDFAQRYVGTIDDDGRTITGQWEIAHDRTTWERDFDLSYHKLTP